MAKTNFCCKSGGSNLNAGTRTGNATEPGTAADFTYASGTWVAATRTFTVASGNPSTDGVAEGYFVSIYVDGSAVTGYVARVDSVTATTIITSATALAGTAPADGVATRTCKVGGAWLGPNAAESFPIGFITTALTNVAGDRPQVNMKNDATYAITAAMTHSNAGPVRFQGYTTTIGDGGKAIIDGGTAGVGYGLMTLSGLNNDLVDLIFQNNGASGTGVGITVSGSECLLLRCVVNNVRTSGISITSTSNTFVECEAYACNQNNSATAGGITYGTGGTSGLCIRCISHDNAGSNSHGFRCLGYITFINCIADTNGGIGFVTTSAVGTQWSGCDSYNNVGDGIDLANTGNSNFYIENCNFIKNGGWGINGSGTAPRNGAVVNCGFGSGTQANTSGQTTGLKSMTESGSVTYPANVTPWVDAPNGDFRTNLAEAIGTGRGSFTQTAAGYAGTVSYPSIGATEAIRTASGGLLLNSGMQGGLRG